MEYFWIPVVTVVLALPVVIVVLLIVYITKTQLLSRDTTAIQRDIAALRNELARMNRAYQRLEKAIATTAQAALPAEDRPEQQDSAGQGMPEIPVEAPVRSHPLSEAESVAPNVAAPDYMEPREPQVYVSPFRAQGEKSLESGGAASRVAAGSASVRPDLGAGSTAGGRSMQSAAAGSRIEQESGRPSRTRAEWESLIGGRLLNWIGALAIIIGIGFFLGYGYQNDWISPALLVGIGALAGFALLAGGDLSFRKGYRIFSQGLLGAGISILYLSVYASFNYFHLEGQGTAFSMMCSVTVLAFVQAFRFDSISVSLLGWAGGFLTPVLVSTGQSNEVALFTYISLLDAGLIAVVAFKDTWLVLQPLTFVGTCLMFIAWGEKFYSPADLSTTGIFLTIFWGLFHALDVWQVVKSPQKSLEIREPVAILNAAFYYLAIYSIVDTPHHDYMATFTLGLAAAYLLTVAALRGMHLPRFTEARFALIGALLLVIATALRFSGFDTVFCWSMEALALILAAVYWKEPGVLWGALLLYLAAIIELLATTGWYRYGSPESFVPLINKRTLAFVGLAAAGALGAEVLRRTEPARTKAIGAFFDTAWCLILFVLIGVEIQDEFGHLFTASEDPESWQFAMYLAIGVAWMIYGLALSWYASQSGHLAHRDVGLFAVAASICAVVVAGASYQPIRDFNPIVNVRAGAFAAELIGLLILLTWSTGPGRGRWPSWTHGASLAVFCLMIFMLCTVETRDYFGKILDEIRQANSSSVLGDRLELELRKYRNLQQVSLSLVWLVYSIALIGYGIWRRILSLRVIAIVIFGIAILKIFIYDLSFLETLYRIFSFIGLGLILLSVSFLYQRFKSAIFEAGPQAEAES